MRNEMENSYKEMLSNYMDHQSERTLYEAQKYSRKLIEETISPEEFISLHKRMLLELHPEISDKVVNSFDVLLEIMMGYGLAYREHQMLRHKQQELNTEIEVASSVQRTLLGTTIPSVNFLDIGAISVPAKHMNGDYFHFVQDEKQSISVAIADVIGKGIPAALCMSMIKYAMDSLPDNQHSPSLVLENLNRVVEQNVDPSMFITMFYGTYHSVTNMFSYSSAGHEPPFYYCAKTDIFSELSAKGLVLGVDKKTKYAQYTKEILIGDMLVLMSDGVTECRTMEGFIEKETLIQFIRKYQHLKAQDIVKSVYKELEKLQNFQLRDDFTLIIFKREV